MIRIDATVGEKSNITLGNYIAYSTYDQGSSKVVAPVIQKPLTLQEQIANLYNEWLSPLTSFIVMMSIAVTLPIIVRFIRDKRKRNPNYKKPT